jgi:hypothetical protein
MSNAITLRSINLRDDISITSRLAHYQPTKRSVPVVRAVFDGGATMVIAAYGSGKSLAAGVGCILVLNKDKEAIKGIVGRLAVVDEDVHTLATVRLSENTPGRVIILSGHVRDVPGAICDALGMARKRGIDPVLDALDKLIGIDRIAIVWDEFGRHLEGIVNEGRSRELDVVQRLAEWAVRARKPRASFTLLLHQNLLAYATALNQTSRNEWRKIEGRFEQIRFVEDSQELYQLAANVISDHRPESVRPPKDSSLRASATHVIAAGWFDGMSDIARVAGLLGRAYPLSAAALQILPRLVARIGQNERSLFAFIATADLNRTIGMEEVYASFSDAMRSDVGIGGSHRRWVEAETARSRAADDVEREALAAACLLQLGGDGERRKLTRSTLETAITSRGNSREQARSAVDALIDRKLLIHRKLNDDVSIWHGADLDLPGRIREERARRMEGFDLVAFLEMHRPAPFIRPTRHNLAFGTARYLQGRYVRASEISSGPDRLPGTQPASEWGRVVFVLADTADELTHARRKIEAGWPGWDRVLVALPAEPISITEAVLEVDALLALQHDDSLRQEDPLVGQEIAELLSVARRQLSVMMHRLTTDRPVTTEWWRGGVRLLLSSDRPAGVAASELLDAAYPATPRIFNDQMMRNRLTRQMETARIRILTRVLEKGHEPQLGYRDMEMSSAEGSVYRTLLKATGLHKQEGEVARFANPEEIKDPGLRAAWTMVRNFFQVPGSKSLADIVSELSAPPVGLPGGVVPLIVVTGLRAFGRAVSLRTDGVYVADLLGFDARRMFLEPGNTRVEVHANDPETLEYLYELAYVFSHHRPAALDERVSFAVGALSSWRSSLPDGVKRSKRHTDGGRKLLRILSDNTLDPPRLLLNDIVTAFGGWHPEDSKGNGKKHRKYSSTLKLLEKARNDIDRLIDGYVRDAVDVVGEILSLHGEGDALAGVQAWVSCFDVTAFLLREDVTMIDKAILRTARDTMNGHYSAESFARAVSSVLLQRGVERWEDGTANQMRRLLRECRARIEEAALSDPSPDHAIIPVLEVRMRDLETKLRRLRASAPPLRAVVGGAG